ncbi:MULTISPECIES: peptidase E [Cyanophyceae]|uniref:Type 1 glutamine amidotransferase-like domain-containing protein n=1 Tax=Cyanophyceae TaxID=3028117 RepID=UPI00168800B6|nr:MULTISPECIES: peptidase E [Cyanophyceae]MBD1918301.1 peptidase E [Phormidium sp. FACHB-77]MBD2028817.1 peptidase E [Phormidium sp. FACHB-322]MBD2051238.1 peptidase E [Leptolyngbya sp. FACHB-60]
MVGQIIAAGGGGFSAITNDLALERYILGQSKNSQLPKVCLLATATGDSDSYIEKFYRAFNSLNCRPIHVPLFKQTPDLESTLLAQDVIYIGGGNTKSMLAVWREWGVPDILRQAWSSGIILSGSSAGAICWFQQGITDSWANRLEVMECLGWFPGSCCPHYNAEPERQPTYHRFLKTGEVKPGYGIPEWSALHFRGDQVFKAISSRADTTVYQVTVENGLIKEIPLKMERIS